MSSPSAKQGSLFLLDGMSLAFRAYFALPADLATSQGIVTNAVHGFASMLLSIVRDHKPGALAVAFDLPGGTFRDEMVEDYKGGRAETPEDLLPQFDMIREMVEVLGIPIVSLEGFEADDVLATLATRSRDEGRPAVVVTGDRDCFQLVEDPYVRVLYNRRGVSDYSLYDEAGIIERTGLEPGRYPMLAALRGDPSDNLPGVPGVGEKTAAKLLTTYGDLDTIFEHLDELTPKLKENMGENEQLARVNLQVMTLVRDVPLSLDPASIELGGWRLADADRFFESLEMRSLWRRTKEMLLTGAFGEGDTSADASVGAETDGTQPADVATKTVPTLTIVDEPDATELLTSLEGGAHVVAVSERSTALLEPEGARVVVAERGSDLEHQLLALKGPVRGLDTKTFLRRQLADGRSVVVPDGDASIAGYLLDASTGKYALIDLVDRYAPHIELTVGDNQAGRLELEHPTDDRAVAEECVAVAALLEAMEPALVELGLDELYRGVELPLAAVLARMEDRGIAVDRKVLQDIADSLRTRVAELEATVQELAGHPFKVNSTQQLREVLFTELGLPPGKKTKTGFSTDASVLEGLVGQHPIIDALLEYRELEKLRSTYGESLLAEIAEDGRIHATFRQTVARTGRLSSEGPNLHNIPVRSEEGRRFRQAFVPSKGWELLVADYDQVELRIIAHLSGDEGLLAAFAAGEDIHRAIAASVYGIAADEVSHDQRERAKMVSYGLAYGMEAFGLSRRLGEDIGEARDIRDRYFQAFPKVQGYMDHAIEEARAEGLTRTELGRIRPLPELRSPNRALKAAAERQAMNAGIQGLAADIFKVALVRLDHRLLDEELSARIVLQVHDEVLVEAPPSERAAVEQAVREELTGAASLTVPLAVSVGWGSSWAAAKG